MLSFDFFIAGRAIFTIANRTTNQHYTYKIIKKSDPKDETKDIYFLNVLTGPDNQNSYTYVGMFIPEKAADRDQSIVLTRKSKYRKDSQVVRVAAWALQLAKTQTEPKEGYELNHAGRCGKCGRMLTEPESLKTGFGPICRAGGIDQPYLVPDAANNDE